MSTFLLILAAIGAIVATVAIIVGLSGYMHRRRFEREYHAALRRLVTHQQRDRYQPGADERDVIGGGR